jgi:hypothetical protein
VTLLFELLLQFCLLPVCLSSFFLLLIFFSYFLFLSFAFLTLSFTPPPFSFNFLSCLFHSLLSPLSTFSPPPFSFSFYFLSSFFIFFSPPSFIFSLLLCFSFPSYSSSLIPVLISSSSFTFSPPSDPHACFQCLQMLRSSDVALHASVTVNRSAHPKCFPLLFRARLRYTWSPSTLIRRKKLYP